MNATKRILTLCLSILMFLSTFLNCTDWNAVYAASIFDLELTSNENGSITANWSKMPQDVYYSLSLIDASGTQDYIYAYEPSLHETTYTTIANLPDGEKYTVALSAHNRYNQSVIATVRESVIMNIGEDGDIQVEKGQDLENILPAPTNVTREITANTFTASWLPVEGATGYVVTIWNAHTEPVIHRVTETTKIWTELSLTK
jgi:hypothetical protein